MEAYFKCSLLVRGAGMSSERRCPILIPDHTARASLQQNSHHASTSTASLHEELSSNRFGIGGISAKTCFNLGHPPHSTSCQTRNGASMAGATAATALLPDVAT